MVTVIEAIQIGAARLGKAGVESARLNVELLLADILGVARLSLHLDSRRELSAEHSAVFEARLLRREAREPVQHILGTAEFFGRVFRVNRHVLVPRPETELLAEWALRTIDESGMSAPVVLDFGTGSGCLAVTLALQKKAAAVHALDVSPDALAVARDNAAALGANVVLHLGDGFKALPDGLVFDGIVSNPPYIPSAEIAGLDPEVRDHDPRLALDGGVDGLGFYHRLAAEAPRYLKPGGWLAVEMGDGQAADLLETFGDSPWSRAEVRHDDTGRERMLRVYRSR